MRIVPLAGFCRTFAAALFFLLLWLPGTLSATHLMGGEARYTYLGALGSGTTPFRYQITFDIYVNCDANSQVPLGRDPICFAVYDKGSKQLITSGSIARGTTPVITPPLPAGCNVPGINALCIRFVSYTTTVDLPISFAGYYAITDDGTRNASVVDIPNPVNFGQSIFIEMAPPTRQNTSPTFSTTALGVVCVGDTVTISNNAVDPNGDVLVYSFGKLYDQLRPNFGGNCNQWPASWQSGTQVGPQEVPYATGYSFTNPFGAGGYASINASTGVTKYYIPNAGDYVVSVEVKEYRIEANGTQTEIGSTRREIQIFARTCPPNPAPVVSSSPSLPPTGGQITVQAGQLATFQVRGCDANPISISATSALFGAPHNATLNTVTGTAICPSTLSSTFNWQTTCNDGGVYSVNVTTLDQGCPPKASNAVYQIVVNPFLGPASITGTNTICGTTSGQKTYSVPAGSANGYLWSVPSGGTIVGAANTNTVNVNWTSIGQHVLRLVTTSAQGCTATLEKVITVAPGQNIQASADVTTCTGNSVTLTATGAAAGNAYVWTGPNLNPSTGSSVMASPTATATYTVSSTDTSGCTSTDQVVVTVASTAATITATPSVSQICINGGPINLTATPAGGTFTGPGLSGSTFNPVTSGAGTFTISYSAIVAAGCTATTSRIITVNNLPVVSFTPPAPLCVDAAPIALTGTPAGGIFSGPGVTGSNFSPATAGAGTHTVTYSYTNALTTCSNTTTGQITVNPLPALAINNLLPAYCISTLPVSINGTPAGGTFTGPGINNTAGTFTPATAGVGTHTITYSFTNTTTGCSNRLTQPVVVNPLPPAGIPNTVPSAVCVNAPVVNLTGTPAGGIFSGTGVTANIFDPDAAGVGPHLITYTYTQPTTGCTNTANKTITVNALPVVSFSGLNPTYCVNALPASLTGSPAGGTFSGSGVSGSSFNPTTAGIGTYNIIYTFTDANTCSSADTQAVEVIAAPAPLIQNLASSYCVDAAAVTISASITGGTFSGPGISGSSFDPATAGAGSHTVTYSVTSGGCTGSVTQAVQVNALPAVSLPLPPAICENATPLTLAGTPAGGTYSGTGISGSTFDPAVAGTGPHALTYSFTDANSCTNAATQTITVNAAPAVSFTLPASACENGSPVTLTGTPAAGMFTGTGVSGSTFSPATAGVGTYTITYSFTDANNCSNTATNAITVNAKPAVAPLAGPPAVCPGLQGVAYHITGVPAASSYQWLAQGGTIAAGQGTDTVMVNWGPTNAAAQLQLVISNAAGCFSDTMRYSVSINQVLPTPTPTGVDLGVCVNAANSTYSVPFTIGSVYTWAVTGGVIVSGQTTNTVVVDWTTAGQGSLVVTETSNTNLASCLGVSAPLNVTVFEAPNAALAISGDLTICASASTLNFSTNNGLPGSTYAWSFNGSPLSGSGSTASTATPAAGTYTLMVTETSNQGCTGPAIDTTVTVNAVPAPVTVSGNAYVCPSTVAGQTFSVQGQPGSTFNWTLDGGGSIVSGQNSNSITVDLDTLQQQKTLTVLETSAEGCPGSPATFGVTVDLLRNALQQVSVDETNFDTTLDVDWTLLQQTLPRDSYVYRRPTGTTGWTLAGSSGGTQLEDQNVNVQTTSYEYQVRSVNACGDTLYSRIHRSVLLKATADEKTSQASFTWNAYEGWNNLRGYQIFRRTTDQGPFEAITDTLTDTEAVLKVGQDAFRQCFRIKAIEADGRTSWSNVMCLDYENPLVVYNVVSVNGSPDNRYFTIANIDLYPDNTLRIFNRWGVKVLERKNYSLRNRWSPTEEAAGVYFYELEIKNGSTYKGWFEIMK